MTTIYILAKQRCEVYMLNKNFIMKVNDTYSFIESDDFDSVVNGLKKVHKIFLTQDHIDLLKQTNPIKNNPEDTSIFSLT